MNHPEQGKRGYASAPPEAVAALSAACHDSMERLKPTEFQWGDRLWLSECTLRRG